MYIYVVAEESNFQTSNSLTKIENILNHWSSGSKVGLCYEKNHNRGRNNSAEISMKDYEYL